MRIAVAALGDHDQFVRGSSFRQRAEYRFGLVRLLFLATFTFIAAGLSSAWTGMSEGLAASSRGCPKSERTRAFATVSLGDSPNSAR
jgi:hypothetical protein